MTRIKPIKPSETCNRTYVASHNKLSLGFLSFAIRDMMEIIKILLFDLRQHEVIHTIVDVHAQSSDYPKGKL